MSYFDGKQIQEGDSQFSKETLESRNDGLFHIDAYEMEKEKLGTQTIYCKICGGNQFYVGKDLYWTGIKCVNCKWEVCIHEG